MFKQLSFILLLLSFLCLPCLAEDLTVDRYVFDCPLETVEFEKFGLDAYHATWPAGVDYENAEIEMMVVTFDSEGVRMMEEGGSAPYLAALSTFAGIFKEPESINKTLFFGSTAARQVYQATIPRKNTLHTFSKTLGDGSFVFVAVRSFKEQNPGVGPLLSAIGNSFRVKE